MAKNKIEPGSTFKDRDGTLYAVFDAIDSSYTYLYVVNFDTLTAIKMRPIQAEHFLKKMKKVDVAYQIWDEGELKG